MLTPESRAIDFPSLKNITYLNTAAEGIPPVAVGRALAQYFSDHQLGMDGRVNHMAQLEELKTNIATMYGLRAGHTAVCSCSSEAYNLLASALNLKEGDEVIINDLDFPAGATPWLLESCPAKTHLWTSREGKLHLEDLKPLLNGNTRLVAVSMVSFFNGFKLDLQAVSDLVRKHSSAILSVDVTQALGRIPLDLEPADIIISSTHKWILATHGGGLIGINPRCHDKLTTQAGGWFNLQDAFGNDRFKRVIPMPGAASFAVGMPNFPAVYAINAALKYIQTVGVNVIDQTAAPLVAQCFEGMRKLPIEMISPNSIKDLAGIIAFRHPYSARLNKTLHANNIHIMEHAGRLRIAIHGYNTPKDIEHLLATLTEAVRA